MGQTLTRSKRNTKNEDNPKYRSGEEYFIKNGGILLEKQIALSGQIQVAGQLKIFSSEDIKKATNNYDSGLLVANGALRAIYYGKLEGRDVAVKAPPLGEPHRNLIYNHLTEASMSMVMNHANMVKLYGCCLETCIPMLVEESFPNGSLYAYLHADVASRKSLVWADRLRIAIEIGQAVSYMHNALAKPVVHRHLASNIVLFHSSFHAKLSNFGFSVPINPGEKPQKQHVEGVPGYIDPEYIETQELTEKCDVYSFGVIMLELLTRRDPYNMAVGGTDIVDAFISTVERNCMMEMIDSEVREQASRDEIQRVAQIALSCVQEKGSERPTMIEVVVQLQQMCGNKRKTMCSC